MASVQFDSDSGTMHVEVRGARHALVLWIASKWPNPVSTHDADGDLIKQIIADTSDLSDMLKFLTERCGVHALHPMDLPCDSVKKLHAEDVKKVHVHISSGLRQRPPYVISIK